jgi:hypothetical protein
MALYAELEIREETWTGVEIGYRTGEDFRDNWNGFRICCTPEKNKHLDLNLRCECVRMMD